MLFPAKRPSHEDDRLMKKRTVITTEKREFWFIRPALESDQEGDGQSTRLEPNDDELIALLDQPREAAASANNQEEFSEREVDHVS